HPLLEPVDQRLANSRIDRLLRIADPEVDEPDAVGCQAPLGLVEPHERVRPEFAQDGGEAHGIRPYRRAGTAAAPRTPARAPRARRARHGCARSGSDLARD